MCAVTIWLPFTVYMFCLCCCNNLTTFTNYRCCTITIICTTMFCLCCCSRTAVILTHFPMISIVFCPCVAELMICLCQKYFPADRAYWFFRTVAVIHCMIRIYGNRQINAVSFIIRQCYCLCAICCRYSINTVRIRCKRFISCHYLCIIGRSYFKLCLLAVYSIIFNTVYHCIWINRIIIICNCLCFWCIHTLFIACLA